MQCPQSGKETAAGDQRCSACGHELTKVPDPITGSFLSNLYSIFLPSRTSCV